MASLTERFNGKDPLSYEVTASVVGGQFLMWDNTAAVRTTTGALPKAKVATAHCTTWLGMAKYDAAPGEEFAETAIAYSNVPINSPTPRVVAAPNLGVYEVVNAGSATVNPGDDVEIVTADGKPGKDGSMVGGRAVVGISVSKSPAPAGSKFRLRLGRY